jgi:hypothetical protein
MSTGLGMEFFNNGFTAGNELAIGISLERLLMRSMLRPIVGSRELEPTGTAKQFHDVPRMRPARHIGQAVPRFRSSLALPSLTALCFRQVACTGQPPLSS